MAKEKEEPKLFYSPKKGCKTKITNRRVSYFVEIIDILSKLKTDLIHIEEDFMYVSDGDVAIKALLRLGVKASVDRKEFKKIVKPIEGEFTTTLFDDRLEFAWGEGNVTSINIEPSREDCDWRFGKELSMFDDDDFYHGLVCGGAGVDIDGNGRLGFVHYDGETVTATDNVVLSQAEYLVRPENRYPFSISGKTIKVWKDLNLPTKYICVYENGCQIMLRDDVIIQDKSNYCNFTPISKALNSKVSQFRTLSGNKFKLSDKIWKSLSMFKKCKEITLKNNEIVSGSENLKVAIDITPFENDEESFTIDISQFYRLKPLVTSSSDFSVIKADVGPHINTFLYVEPDPGLEDAIIIGGIAEEKE